MKETITIMKTPPHVTDEEIRSYMDFDRLLKQKDRLSRRGKNTRRMRYILLSAASLIALVTLLYFLRHPEIQSTVPAKKTPQGLSTPSTADTTRKEPSISDKQARALQKEIPRKEKQRDEEIQNQAAAMSADSTAVIAQPVYVQAEPLAGYAALYEYFNSHLVYPREAVRDSIEGIVNVSFVIDTTGKPKRIEVENSLGMLFDKEAIRLITNMPSWKSATYNGKPVESKISIPLTFDIQRVSNP